MEKQYRHTLYVLILLGAFVIALAFRLIRLGVLPLSHMEAGFSLQALSVASGGNILFGDQITYVGWTGITFFLLTSGNFLARFWPAFSGALIVFIPFLFRKQIGEWPAVLASIVLAVSSEMVGLSRMVGSQMMAMVFLILAIGFFFRNKPILMGLCLGLGLMSGPGFWMGVLILGLSISISMIFFGWREYLKSHLLNLNKPFWIYFVLAFGLTLLVVGTGFFMAPAALSGIFSGLYTFIISFGTPRLTPFGLMPFAILAYALGALIFGLWGGIRGILVRSKLDSFLFTWALTGLGFLLLYPGGSPADIIWVTLPLWLLSARVIYFAWPKSDPINIVEVITAVSVIVIFAFMLVALRNLVTPSLTQSQQLNYLIAMVAGAVLLIAVTLLVNYAWSETVARTGLLLGLGLVFSAGMISVSVNATGIGPNVPYEFWYPEEPALYTDWLEVTIDRVLVWNSRRSAPVDINVAGIDLPGMHWALHDYDHVEFVPFIPPQKQPGILITEMGMFPEISNSYQGQGLVWMWKVPWQDLSARQYLTWLVTRDVPTIPTELILWVRTDLMPSGQFLTE